MENGSSTNIKFSKTQLSKMAQSGGFFPTFNITALIALEEAKMEVNKVQQNLLNIKQNTEWRDK